MQRAEIAVSFREEHPTDKSGVVSPLRHYKCFYSLNRGILSASGIVPFPSSLEASPIPNCSALIDRD